jgi:hypothetical protein
MTSDKMAAFEAFRRQRQAMLAAFSAWAETRPGHDVLEDEGISTFSVMRQLSRLPGDNYPEEASDV